LLDSTSPKLENLASVSLPLNTVSENGSQFTYNERVICSLSARFPDLELAAEASRIKSLTLIFPDLAVISPSKIVTSSEALTTTF
jgi:hypothetical protein